MRIRATYMRGGTSKGIFFERRHLPEDPAERDRLLLRVIGSPDPWGRQTDGMGGATSSTSKVVLVWPSDRADSDVAYLFGQVAIDRPAIDWTGNCGNLTAAVAPFAIARGLFSALGDGIRIVRLWQANLGEHIEAAVPIAGGLPLEVGTFPLDGVPAHGAKIEISFLGAEDEQRPLLPTGETTSHLAVPGLNQVPATLIDAGNPTVIVHATTLGLRGTELQPELNADAALLVRIEAIRVAGSLAMGLAATPAEAAARQHTPKLAFVAAPQGYTASNGRAVEAETIDLTARIVSMGRLHHAMTGTGAVALAVAAAIPGTIVATTARPGRDSTRLRFGHPSGTSALAAEVTRTGGVWRMRRTIAQSSARVLMDGHAVIPDGTTGDEANY